MEGSMPLKYRTMPELLRYIKIICWKKITPAMTGMDRKASVKPMMSMLDMPPTLRERWLKAGAAVATLSWSMQLSRIMAH